MQLAQDNPGFRYVLRGVGAGGILVNQATLSESFLVSPDQLVEGWRPRDAAGLQPQDLEPVLALSPAVFILGTGARGVFPAQAVLAAMLTRGVGIEVMDSAAAARTFNVLATEGRAVVAGFLVPG